MTKQKRVQVWLYEPEYEFLQSYAESFNMTVSELVKMWVREVAKKEGAEIPGPRIPERVKKQSEN